MKILQKHQAGEGSVNLHLEGAVTTNQDGGLRKLLVKDNSSVGWHLISPALVLSGCHLSLANCLAPTYCYDDLSSTCTALEWMERFVCFVLGHLC